MKNLLGTDYLLEIDTVTAVATNTRGTEANYRLVACLTSNGFELTNAEQTTSNKCDDGWATSLSGMGSWTMSGEGQAVSLEVSEEATRANFQDIAELALEKTIFFLRWTDAAGTIVREGKVRIGSYAETAPNAEAYTFTVSFVGIGKPFLVPVTT